MTFSAFREDKYWLYGNMFEIIFLIDIIVHFLLNFVSKNQSKTEIHGLKTLLETMKNYWYGDFIYDLIPFVPFQLFKMYRNR
jgi:hypothetical protein